MATDATTTASMPAALTASLAPGQVRRARADDTVDGLAPTTVITAQSTGDVATIVGAARTEGLALIAVGGGTQIEVGNRPAAFDVRLATSGMAAITERCPDDMVVIAEAGVTLAQINRALLDSGQRIAVDAGDPQRATLGGIVSANAAGGLTHGFGPPRDLVLGMTVVDGRGRTLQIGGRVVKNVAGYDLPRLFAGAHGTLGVITSLTLRTHPLPQAATTLRTVFERADDLAAATAALLASGMPLAALDFEATSGGDGAPWSLVARVEGTQSEVSYQAERIETECKRGHEIDEEAWRSPVHARATENLVVRARATSSASAQIAAELLEAGAARISGARVAAQAASGTVSLAGEVADAKQALAALREVEGRLERRAIAVQVLRCPVGLKSAVDVWGAQPPGFALMRRLKERFDPDRVLSPGRFVGRL